MKIVIVGVGKLGEYLAHELVNDNNEITLVDLDFYGKEYLINNEDVNYIEGNGVDYDILKEAGVGSADILISVMDNDEYNIVSSLIGEKLGVKHTIARIRKPEYTKLANIIKEDLKLSMTINPEYLTALEIVQTLSIPSALSATSFLKGRLEVVSILVKENSNLNKIKIKNLTKKLDNKVLICSIEREGKFILPGGDDIIYAGDKLNITGTRTGINSFLKFDNLITDKIRNVIISGGSNIAIYLSRSLIELGMNVKIIENNKERCKLLSDLLPDALIINGDVSDQNLLHEEGIDEADAFISLTSIDEENIIHSMFASIVGVKKIITKINHIDLDGVIEKSGVQTIVTPHKVAANHVVQYLRAMENSGDSIVEALYKFDDGLEMLQLHVEKEFEGIGIKLKDLNLKDGILVVAIGREKNIIIPNGNDVILENDTLVIRNGNDYPLKNLNDIIG